MVLVSLFSLACRHHVWSLSFFQEKATGQAFFSAAVDHWYSQSSRLVTFYNAICHCQEASLWISHCLVFFFSLVYLTSQISPSLLNFTVSFRIFSVIEIIKLLFFRWILLDICHCSCPMFVFFNILLRNTTPKPLVIFILAVHFHKAVQAHCSILALSFFIHHICRYSQCPFDLVLYIKAYVTVSDWLM